MEGVMGASMEAPYDGLSEWTGGSNPVEGFSKFSRKIFWKAAVREDDASARRPGGSLLNPVNGMSVFSKNTWVVVEASWAGATPSKIPMSC
jgi:hypothetical protein